MLEGDPAGLDGEQAVAAGVDGEGVLAAEVNGAGGGSIDYEFTRRRPDERFDGAGAEVETLGAGAGFDDGEFGVGREFDAADGIGIELERGGGSAEDLAGMEAFAGDLPGCGRRISEKGLPEGEGCEDGGGNGGRSPVETDGRRGRGGRRKDPRISSRRSISGSGGPERSQR